MFMIMRIEEVLPAPFGPSSPKILPAGTAIETLSTATKSPYALRTFRSSRIGVMVVPYRRRGGPEAPKGRRPPHRRIYGWGGGRFETARPPSLRDLGMSGRLRSLGLKPQETGRLPD